MTRKFYRNKAGAVITPGLRSEWAKMQDWLKENDPRTAQERRNGEGLSDETPAPTAPLTEPLDKPVNTSEIVRGGE